MSTLQKSIDDYLRENVSHGEMCVEEADADEYMLLRGSISRPDRLAEGQNTKPASTGVSANDAFYLAIDLPYTSTDNPSRMFVDNIRVADARMGSDPPPQSGASVSATNNHLRTVQKTTAQVLWTYDGQTLIGSAAESVDISPIVQEIVDRPGLSSANSIMPMVEGDPSSPTSLEQSLCSSFDHNQTSRTELSFGYRGPPPDLPETSTNFVLSSPVAMETFSITG